MRRDSKFLNNAYPFEVLHINEPANNMQNFHWHNFFEISFINSGEGIYEIERKRYRVKAGDVVIINGIQKHRVVYNSDTPLYETVLHFDRELIWSGSKNPADHNFAKLFSLGPDFVNCPELEENTKEEIACVIKNITKEYLKKNELYELIISLEIKKIIALILREETVKEKIRPLEAKRIKEVIEFINQNAFEDISMSMVADEFYMNSSYFSDYFKQKVGINFTEYIARVRINKAIQLMEDTELTTAYIAMACGYNSVSCFYTAFKKIMGVSPAKYIKQ